MNQLDAIEPWSEWHKEFSMGWGGLMFVRRRLLANGGYQSEFKPITPFTNHVARRKHKRLMRQLCYA